MEYEVEFRPAAVKDLEGMDPSVGKPVLAKIDVMRHDLAGDVKRLPEMRGTAFWLVTGAYYSTLLEIAY